MQKFQHPVDMASLNLLWGSLILEELSRIGVKHICMAPGSRSTPLTLAAAQQQKLQLHTHFDERGLGFLALGLAKTGQSPVAIITTSGTAVANLYPAIIEAWLTQVPLIVLSGDRPPELIDCGANQAIDQVNIFGNYAKAITLTPPNLETSPQFILSNIDELVCNQTFPVHINCMYREPLYPKEYDLKSIYHKFSDYLKPLAKWHSDNQPWTNYPQVKTCSDANNFDIEKFANEKGIIVVGKLAPEDNPEAIIYLADKLGWPILADGQSQLRQHPKVINHIDQLLLSKKIGAELTQAKQLIVFGGRILSKRLIQFIAEHDWQQYWQILSHQQRLDPNHNSKQIWLGDITDFCALPWQQSIDSQWAKSLITENQKLEAFFEKTIDQGEFGEAQVIRSICKNTISNQLFIGNSLPIRLYDMYAPAQIDRSLIKENTKQHRSIFTNRGASGIDGLLATACGVALGNSQATTLIIGDLSQLHDLNSLAIAAQIKQPLVIVIINNNGGNIFNLLAVPNESIRSKYYRLSHNFNFSHAAAMFDLPYRQVNDIGSFEQSYQEYQTLNQASIIEVIISSQQASEQINNIKNWSCNLDFNHD